MRATTDEGHGCAHELDAGGDADAMVQGSRASQQKMESKNTSDLRVQICARCCCPRGRGAPSASARRSRTCLRRQTQAKQRFARRSSPCALFHKILAQETERSDMCTEVPQRCQFRRYYGRVNQRLDALLFVMSYTRRAPTAPR